eukprot:1162105-Pelagomonas_calceolata.AAC.15
MQEHFFGLRNMITLIVLPPALPGTQGKNDGCTQRVLVSFKKKNKQAAVIQHAQHDHSCSAAASSVCMCTRAGKGMMLPLPPLPPTHTCKRLHIRIVCSKSTLSPVQSCTYLPCHLAPD